MLLKISKASRTCFNTLGHYKVTTWKSYDDIRLGVNFNGKTVAQSDYLIVERRYIAFLLDLSQELACPFLAVDVEAEDLTVGGVSSFLLTAVDKEQFLKDWLRQKIDATLYLNKLKLTLASYLLYLDGDIDRQLIENLSHKHQLYCEELIPREEISCFKISKYNPIYRDEQGRYHRDEWTDFSDIGKTFADGVLTLLDYERIEHRYLSTIYSCFAYFQEDQIDVVDVEYYSVPTEPDLLRVYQRIRKGESCFTLADLPALVQLNLRNYIWAKIIGEKIECHFGFDFYVYLQARKATEQLLSLIAQHQLFVELMANLEE